MNDPIDDIFTLEKFKEIYRTPEDFISSQNMVI